jgi:hypothetical protein
MPFRIGGHPNLLQPAAKGLERLQQRQSIAELTDGLTVAANHECLAYSGIADASDDVREVCAVADRARRKVRAHVMPMRRQAIRPSRASRQRPRRGDAVTVTDACGGNAAVASSTPPTGTSS